MSWRTGSLWKEPCSLAEVVQGIFRVSKSVFGLALASLQARGEGYSSIGCEMRPSPVCAQATQLLVWLGPSTRSDWGCACERVRERVRACAQLPRASSAPDVGQGQAGWEG